MKRVVKQMAGAVRQTAVRHGGLGVQESITDSLGAVRQARGDEGHKSTQSMGQRVSGAVCTKAYKIHQEGTEKTHSRPIYPPVVHRFAERPTL